MTLIGNNPYGQQNLKYITTIFGDENLVRDLIAAYYKKIYINTNIYIYKFKKRCI